MGRKLFIRLTVPVFIGIILLVSVVSALQIGGAAQMYLDWFAAGEKAAEGGLSQEIAAVLATAEEDAVKDGKIAAAVSGYGGALGLDENRAWFLLSARDGTVLYPMSMRMQEMAQTENLSTAMRGGKGVECSLYKEELDWALFLPNGDAVADGYVLYVRDNKTALGNIVDRGVTMGLWALGAGALLSIALGLLLTWRQYKPMAQMIQRAEQFADGKTPSATEKMPGGEFEELGRALNRLGSMMNQTMNRNSTEAHKIEIILEHINNGIIAFDTKQKVVHINPAAKKMFLIRNTTDLRFDDFFRGMGTNICMAEYLYLNNAKAEKRELIWGEKRIRAYLAPFRMDEEKIAGVVCVFEDVTEQFNLEAARQKFVAEVSHELKTPLTTIRTYTETLLSGYLDDKRTATTLLETVQSETDKMTALVQNLLILNRFDMQRVDLNRTWFSADEMLRHLAEVFRLQAEQKGLELSYTRTTDMPEIYADESQLERAVTNIISNSIKYCTSGDSVKIFAGSLYDDGIYIKVEDTGKGIPQTDLPHVFERFYRVDKARSRDRGGTGLGLPITKEIIESHGGTITIESKFGSYTRVTINLPEAGKQKN